MDVPAPLQVEFQQSSLYAWMVLQIQFIDRVLQPPVLWWRIPTVQTVQKTDEIPQVLFLVVNAPLLYNDWSQVVTVLITVKVPQLQYLDKVDDVPVVQVVVGVSSSWTR